MVGVSRPRRGQRFQGYADGAVELIDAEYRHDDADQLDVRRLVEPGCDVGLHVAARDAGLIRDDAMHGVDRRFGEFELAVVPAIHRIRRQRVLAPGAQFAIQGIARGLGDGDALGTRPPATRAGEALPECGVRRLDVVPDRNRCLGIVERGHELLSLTKTG